MSICSGTLVTISPSDPIISSPSQCLSGLSEDTFTLASSSAQNILVNSQQNKHDHLSTLSSPQQIKEHNSSFGDTSLMSPLLSPPDQLSLSPSQLGPLSPQSPLPLAPPSPINGHNESWDTETQEDNLGNRFREIFTEDLSLSHFR